MSTRRCAYAGHTFNPAAQGERFAPGLGYVPVRQSTEDKAKWHCPGCDRAFKVFAHPWSSTYLMQFPQHKQAT